MINLNTSIQIYRPVTTVFDFVSAPENDFLWQYGTLASAQISESIIGRGACFRSIGHIMGHRTQSTFEVTEYEPNRKYGFKSLTGPLQSQTTYAFEIEKGSTRITISIQANAINLLQLSEGILEKRMKKQLKENLALLKEILETRKPV